MSEMNKSNVVSCRLNTDQVRKLDAKAKEKGIPRSMLVKYIILEYLEKELEHVNLLQAGIMNVQDELKKSNDKIEFLMQMFYSWLVTWFTTVPKADNVSETFKNDAVSRRNKWGENFVNEVFNDATELYESLFAQSVENQDTQEDE